MKLTKAQIINFIKNPAAKDVIRDAILHELRLNCYCNGSNVDFFLNECKSFFVPELAKNIEQSFAIHSKPFLAVKDGSIYSHFNKVNNSTEGKKEEIEFENAAEKRNYLQYIQEAYLDRKSNWYFFNEPIIDLILYSPNARLIADFRESTDETKPTIQIAYITQIHDISESIDGINYLIVKKQYGKYRNSDVTTEIPAVLSQSDSVIYSDYRIEYTKYFIYDTEKYCVYKCEGRGTDNLVLESENYHNLGFCPAKSVSYYSVDNYNYAFKKSPISTSLDEIFSFNFIKNIAKFFHWQNGVPISFRLNKRCKATYAETGIECDNGYFKVPSETNLDNATDFGRKKSRYTFYRCHSCERAALEKMTFGQTIAINSEDVKAKPELIDILKKSFSYVGADTALMSFNYDVLDKFEQKIKDQITGEGFNTVRSKEAFNKEQIRLSTDDKQSNLATFAAQIEKLQEWADAFIAKTRYTTFQYIKVDFGRTFFFQGKEENYDLLKKLRESTGNAFLEYKNVFSAAVTENRFMPDDMQVFEAFSALIPLQNLTTEQVLKYASTLLALGFTPNELMRRLNSMQILALFSSIQKDQFKANERSNFAKINSLMRFIENYFPQRELVQIQQNNDPNNLQNLNT